MNAENVTAESRIAAFWSTAGQSDCNRLVDAVRCGPPPMSQEDHIIIANTLVGRVRRVLQAEGQAEPWLMAAAEVMDPGFAAEMMRRDKPTPPATQQQQPSVPQNYHRSVLSQQQTDRPCPCCGGKLVTGNGVMRCPACIPDEHYCRACGEQLHAINGLLRCASCPAGQPAAPSRDTVPEPANREPELITPEFLLCTHPTLNRPGDERHVEPAQRYLMTTMRNGDVPMFVCPVCYDSKPHPGMQSPAVAAAAAIPVIGPIAGPVVQAIEHVIRPGKRARG